ncbi:MAG TPA: Smr/MutS family protein [Acidobacteriaceae bacterium]|nr:Smr/MutS family protein [Acidobacteriaceae bacterium]
MTRTIPERVSDCNRAALEWDRFLELLGGYAQSAAGRAWVAAMGPSTDAAWIEREHALVEEMRLLAASGSLPGLATVFDPTELLARARIEGTALEAEEIRAAATLAEVIAAWAEVVRVPAGDLAGRLPELKVLFGEVLSLPLKPLVDALRGKFLPDGSLADDASPELRRIRREMDRQHRAIESSLRAALRRYSEGGSAQDELITIRGERFVIPVKAEWKRRVQGVVHGASSSGQTVYVEPLETIELNNDLVRLLEDEQAEIHRIFAAMTRQIAQYGGVIAKGAEALCEADTLLARARFGVEFSCVRPKLSTDPTLRAEERAKNGAPTSVPELRLKAARHPLLEKRLRSDFADPTLAQRARKDGAPQVVAGIVPISVSLTGDVRQMVISGPNTGGKSVTLKTVGLLAMMAQSGVPVPAEEAVFPLFDAFLADIGDAQSIEQNLSTFSAHITNVNWIAKRADAVSLVLLDELGSATDPNEGQALAVAIAEHFLRKRAWVILSTHLTALKVYAENTPGVVNAAVGFDEETLAPTYELRQGVPGASAGINIAARLGLDAEIIAAARQRVGSQTEEIGKFLDRLHAQLGELTAERDRVQRLDAELKRERQRLETEGMKEWRTKVREMEQKLASLLKDFEYQIRETVRAIDDRAAQQKLSKEAERRMARLRREFAESFNAQVVAQHTGADKGDANAQPHVVKQVAAGDTVRLRSLGKDAVVQRQVDEKTFEVSVGPMKMRVGRDEIAAVVKSAGAAEESPLAAARARKGITVTAADPTENLHWEINVIGRTADEAQDEVEKFLDKAFLAGLPRVRIIHGTGMGVLRRSLRAYLGQHPQVASVTEPGHNEGGAGATVVELR